MIRLKINTTGGDDPPSGLTPQQMADWNKYVSYVEKRGYKGSKDLDKKETGLARKLLDDFIKETPGVSIKYDDVKKVQQEMIRLRDQAQAFEARRGNPNASKVMSGTSSIDGWPGSKTTSFMFPDMQTRQFVDGSLVEQKNLGLVGGDLKPTGVGGSLTTVSGTRLPAGTPLEKMGDGRYYYKNKDGDFVLYQ